MTRPQHTAGISRVRQVEAGATHRAEVLLIDRCSIHSGPPSQRTRHDRCHRPELHVVSTGTRARPRAALHQQPVRALRGPGTGPACQRPDGAQADAHLPLAGTPRRDRRRRGQPRHRQRDRRNVAAPVVGAAARRHLVRLLLPGPPPDPGRQGRRTRACVRASRWTPDCGPIHRGSPGSG
jgi:hypothetical protein